MKKAMIIAGVFCLIGIGRAAVIEVPVHAPTIQAGIDSASAGDTVLVQAGTYTGSGNRDISFGGKPILLLGDGGAENVIIDCQAGPSDAHKGFYIHEDEDRSTIIDGFTVTNAQSDFTGAIYIENTSPTIRKCKVSGNDDLGIVIRGYGNMPLIDSCVIEENLWHGIDLSDVLYPIAGLELTNSVIARNGLDGIHMRSPADVIISNCTIVYNDSTGIYIEGDPPKSGQGLPLTRTVSNCIIAYNVQDGLRRIFIDQPFEYYCNDVYGNVENDFNNVPPYPGDPNGNFSLPPLFCDDDPSSIYPIHEFSPCAPDYSPCGELVGATGIGCSEIVCADANGDGIIYTVGDLVYMYRFVTGEAVPTAPWANMDVDLCGNVNIADVALYVEYFTWGLMVGLCEPADTCYYSTENNEVFFDCPTIARDLDVGDSIPFPVYISNDRELTALSLGFSFDSDRIEFSSIDTSGSVAPEDWNLFADTPRDSAYAWPVEDSNVVLITGIRDPAIAHYLMPQTGGLLATLWFKVTEPIATEFINVDSIFVMPAGEFAFAPRYGGIILPYFSPCSDEEIIATANSCGDMNEDGTTDIDDAVWLIFCIFGDCIGPDIPVWLDPNCSGNLDIDDVVYLIQYIFVGGPPPCDPNDDGVPDC